MLKTPFAGEISAGTIFSRSCWCRYRELPSRIYEESLSRLICNRMISNISVQTLAQYPSHFWFTDVLNFRLLFLSSLSKGIWIGREAMFIMILSWIAFQDCKFPSIWYFLCSCLFFSFSIISLCFEGAFDNLIMRTWEGNELSAFGSISPNKQWENFW